MQTNNAPQIKETKIAIWARVLMVYWSVIIPLAEQIGKYEDILFEEASGILNWALEGCLEWQRIGISAPSAVTSSTEDYRDSEDVIGEYIAAQAKEIRDDRCTPKKCIDDPNGCGCGVVPVTDLRADYDNWCQSVGEYPLKARTWNARLETRGFRRASRNVNGKGVKCWVGLKLNKGGGAVPANVFPITGKA